MGDRRADDGRGAVVTRPACEDCGHVHVATDTTAVGRYRVDGPLGYRSTASPAAPLRITRHEAEQDTCEARQGRVTW